MDVVNGFMANKTIVIHQIQQSHWECQADLGSRLRHTCSLQNSHTYSGYHPLRQGFETETECPFEYRIIASHLHLKGENTFCLAIILVIHCYSALASSEYCMHCIGFWSDKKDFCMVHMVGVEELELL